MKTKKLLIGILAMVSFFLLALCGGSVYYMAKAQETEVGKAIESFENEYKIGTKIEIPDAYFNGGKVKATKTVVYPDGSQYRVNEFVPAITGVYSIEYSALVDGERLESTKDICVYGDLYSVSNSASTLYYGTNELTPNTMGLNVGLQSGQVFSYNKVIDLASLGNQPFVSLYMAPENIREADGFDFVITLTDAYDSSNYINIRVCNTSETITYQHFRSYISAGAAFQPMLGIDATGNVHKNSNWGFDQMFTFYGCDANGNADEDLLTSKRTTGQLQLFFDLDEKKLKTQGNTAGKNEVIDFDNPKYYTDLWSGFSTGEVYLSIKAKTVYTSRLNFVVTEIAGDDLKTNKYTDDSAPLITVDTLGYDELPHAVVGHQYPVFEFEAADAYRHIRETNVAVYRNYGSPSQSNVNVDDGCFIPVMSGNYYIVYSATDYFGNRGEKIITVICDSTENGIELTVTEKGRIVTANVGESVELPHANVSGGNGNVTVSICVLNGDGKEVEIKDGCIVPDKAGTYTVTYTARDFVGSEQEYSYTIDVMLSYNPVFAGREPIFEKYYISGYEYILPKYKAFDYANAGNEVAVAIKVTDDDGERTLSADRKVTFVVKNVGETKSFKVKYEASNANGKTVKEFIVTVINTKREYKGNQRLDLSKYFFATEAVQVVAESESIELIASATGTAEFINPLLASGFSMDFTLKNSEQNGLIKIALEDSLDASQRVELILSRNSALKTNCKVVGGNTYELPIVYTGGMFSLSYNALDKTVTFDSENYMPLKNTDGTEFGGFNSGKLRLYIEFLEMHGNVSIDVTRINMQNLSSAVIIDRVSPRISVAQEQPTRVKKNGEIVNVYSAIAVDVVCPVINVFVSVTAPDGNSITSVDGIVLKNVDASRSYQFEISQYGSYRITYTTTDGENSSKKTEILNALDVDAPVITLTRNNITVAKKGSVVVVAPVDVSDNYTAKENIFVRCFVVRPTGNMINIDLTTSNSFVTNETGVYIIRYMAMDEASNVSTVESELIVEE